MNFKAALLPALIALSSCAAHPHVATREFFDEQTASTLSVVGKPLVFERPRSDVAAHGHDFATLVAIEVNNSGKDSEYLLLYRWSTVDRRMSPPPDPDQGLLRLLADGRKIELKPLERLPVSLTERRRLHFPEHGEVVTRAYRVDLDLLRYLSTSGELVLRLPEESLDTPFTLWDDQRASLAQFAGKAP